MSDKQEPKIELEIPLEIKNMEPTAPQPESSQEIPTVTTLLQRKKFEPAKSAEQGLVNPDLPPPLSSLAEEPAVTPSRRRQGQTRLLDFSKQPPVFQGILKVEPLEVKALQKLFKKNSSSVKMKKLACLGYFTTRFEEIAYFEANQTGGLSGSLGFGNKTLVASIREQILKRDLLPSLFSSLTRGNSPLLEPAEALSAQERDALSALGLKKMTSIGVFPVFYREKTHRENMAALWLCTSMNVVEIPIKELKALQETLTELLS